MFTHAPDPAVPDLLSSVTGVIEMLTSLLNTSISSVLPSVSKTIDDCEDSIAMSLLGLIQDVDAATEIAAAISPILLHVCEATDWDYGEIWIPSANSKVLELSNVWQIASDAADETSLEQFRLCSEGLVVSPGEGLPGRVWLSEQPEWIADATAKSESYYLRNQLARAFDINAGFGVPIIANERVWAVIVFFKLGIDR
jgi:signal transduction protein with GAF and PtsI domain